MNRSTCTICSDLLTLTDVAACPCGHTFHYQCLLAWKERSATCPQCRLRFNTPIKLFFDIAVSEESDVDVSALKNQLNDLKMNLILKEQDCTKMREQQSSYESEITVKKQELQTMSELLQNTQGHNSILKKQILYLEKFKSDCEKTKAEVVLLEKKLTSFGNISELVKGDRHEVEAILKNYTDSSESLSQIKTSYIILKNAFDKLQETKNKLEIEKRKCKRHAEALERERCEQNEKLETLNKDVIHLNAINKKLMEKVQNLECSFNFPSPCIASSKRTFTESSEPVIKKRSRLYEKDDSNATLDLFDNSSELTEKSFDIKSDKEIEELFGLKRVATTNIADHRVPLRDIKSIKCNIKTQAQTIPSCGPLMRQGFNGMGGQSRLLVLPKKSSSAIAKTAATIRNVSRKFSKNKSRDTLRETKISDFLGSPITISP